MKRPFYAAKGWLAWTEPNTNAKGARCGICLLASMLELEWQDAAMVGALTYIAKLIVGVAILAAMMG